MRITDPISVVGVFWCPNKPEQRLHGTLEVADGGEITLTVIGNFDSDLESINDFEIVRIVGIVEKGDT